MQISVRYWDGNFELLTKLSLHQSIRLGIHFVPSCSGIVVLKLQHIGYMRSILDVKISPKGAFFNRRKVTYKHRIHNPKPQTSQKNPQSRPSKDLSHTVVPQIHPRIHSQQSQAPRQEIHGELVLGVPEPNSFICQKGEVDGEEEHVLRVTRRPSMGVAHFEEGTRFGPSLLEEILDHFVDELGNYEADCEEHALELTAEDEVGDEPAEAYEDWD